MLRLERPLPTVLQWGQTCFLVTYYGPFGRLGTELILGDACCISATTAVLLPCGLCPRPTGRLEMGSAMVCCLTKQLREATDWLLHRTPSHDLAESDKEGNLLENSKKGLTIPDTELGGTSESTSRPHQRRKAAYAMCAITSIEPFIYLLPANLAIPMFCERYSLY